MTTVNNFKTKSYCVGSGNPKSGIKGHYSPTVNIHGAIAKNGAKYLKGTCTICSRNKSMFVSDATIEGEGLGEFFKNIGKQLKNVGKTVGKNIAKNPGKALDLALNLGMAGASKNPSAILQSGMQTGKFLATGRGVAQKRHATVGRGVKIGQLTDGSGLYLHRK